MKGSAVFSPCGRYRYRLDRDLECAGPVVALYGVNPSTAGAEDSDATIDTVARIARHQGWGRFIMANVFAFISTDVRRLAREMNPVGEGNIAVLSRLMFEADIHVAAWGSIAKLPPRLRSNWRTVAAIAETHGVQLQCFGINADGHPRHPLYLKADTPLAPWVRP